MKALFLLFFIVPVIISPGFTCKNKASSTSCYKARLQIKGICSNYTLELLQGSLDTTLIDPEWKDEQSGKTYQNVFGLSNPCTFPDSLEEGDEFYFTIAELTRTNCNVCMAYYPTPAKKLNIVVTKTPCK